MHFISMARPIGVLITCLLIALNITMTQTKAGPGHDHGDGGHDHGASTATTAPKSPRIVAVSPDYELVGILKDGHLVVYLDRKADTSPVQNAKIEMTVGDKTNIAKPQDDGTYVLHADTLQKQGKHEIIAMITDGEKSDIVVGTLQNTPTVNQHDHADDLGHDHSVHHQEGQASSPTHNDVTKLLSNPLITAVLGTLFGLILGMFAPIRKKGTAALTLLVAILITTTDANTVHAGPGHDHDHGAAPTSQSSDAPQRLPDGSLFLPKPTQRLLEIRTQILEPATTHKTERLIGRVIPDPNKSGFVQSTIGGRIKAPKSGLPVLGQHVKAGEILAYVEPAFTPIDASDVRQTEGDLDQKIELLKAKVERQKELVKRGLGNRTNIEYLIIELEGLQARKADLAKSRTLPETLVAPIDGVVSEVSGVAGQVITSAHHIIHIIDTSSLWIEAVAFDTRLALDAKNAKARTTDGKLLDLTFIGRSRALQLQSTVLHFKINTPPDTLNIGTPLDVLIEDGKPITGLILPRNAVAQAPNGQLVAFKRLEAEHYQPVPIRFDDLDGNRIRVTDGLKPGDQVIIKNAPLVNQIR